MPHLALHVLGVGSCFDHPGCMRGPQATPVDPGQAEFARGRLALCFPAFSDAQPTVTEMLMVQEIIGRCDVHFLLPRTCMEYARKHKKDGLVPRSVKALHAAICGADVSTINGLMAQTKQHEPQECWQCKAAAKDIMCKRCGKKSTLIVPHRRSARHRSQRRALVVLEPTSSA